MNGLTIHEYTLKIPGVAPKVLYHFSDAHLNLSDADSCEQERDTAAQRAKNWENGRKQFALGYGEPYGEAQQRSALQHFDALFELAQTDGDALVIAGDAFDYVNEAHHRFYDTRFSALTVPYLYVCGNHEYDGEIITGSKLDEITRPVQMLDLGDVLLVGFNDAQRVITKEQLDCLAALLEGDKPLILAMHIPIQTADNVTMARCDDYFRINYPGAPAENLAFCELIQSRADKIAAVLAGHLHFLNTCPLAPGLVQFVSSQGITGHINRYHIGE